MQEKPIRATLIGTLSAMTKDLLRIAIKNDIDSHDNRSQLNGFMIVGLASLKTSYDVPNAPGGRFDCYLCGSPGCESERFMPIGSYLSKELNFIFYDVTDEASFQRVSSLPSVTAEQTFVLVGLTGLGKERVISEEQGLALAKDKGASFVEIRLSPLQLHSILEQGVSNAYNKRKGLPLIPIVASLKSLSNYGMFSQKSASSESAATASAQSGKAKKANAPLAAFRCPLSGEVMTDPVVLKQSGVSYERNNLEDYLAKNNKDPLKRVDSRHAEMIPNRALKEAIATWGVHDIYSGSPLLAFEDPITRELMDGAPVILPETGNTYDKHELLRSFESVLGSKDPISKVDVNPNPYYMVYNYTLKMAIEQFKAICLYCNDGEEDDPFIKP